jgi:YidC/Oxa1 family membrane protein insertase
MRYLVSVVICLVIFCGALATAADSGDFSATGGPAKSILLGAKDPKTENPETGFKFQLELTSKGAAIRKATFTGFDNRDPKDPQPLVILSPVRLRGGELLSMAITQFVLVEQERQFALDKLSWKSIDVEVSDSNTDTARFEAIINDPAGKPVVRLIQTYRVYANNYLLDCTVIVENLTDSEQKVHFNLTGPVGIGREDVGYDMREVVASFRDSQNGQVTSLRLDKKKLIKAKTPDDRRLEKGADHFLWAASVNKYFAAILVPVPEADKAYCDWVADKTGWFYKPDADKKNDSDDETVGVALKTAAIKLAEAGQADSAKAFNFQLYLGPKEKSLFDKNELYKNLGFVHTIKFWACCCPASIISPLAFGILALMKWMHSFIANYGVVIIILVFLVRLAMHPISKKSQVSMSKMSELAPKAEEIRKKYANNKTELNRQMMQLYKEQGASPILGFLPLMLQMPIWIALYSAINASVALRGAPFLPFWITDLSAPDALYTFSTPIVVPLLGWRIASLNLLPILMGVAFYLQQKLMPSQAAANPQVAQQQKIMMVMLPVLFPLMLYSRASGLNLYIMASTFAGVIEQYFIRKHMRTKKQEESKGLVAATSKTGGKVKKKKPKPFFKQF